MKRTSPMDPCCRRCHRQLLLKQAGSLREAAARESESTLLQAAVWLEGRARRSREPVLALEVALHYLVLAEHPEVRGQVGLAGQYLSRADLWLETASGSGSAPGRPPGPGAALHS